MKHFRKITALALSLLLLVSLTACRKPAELMTHQLFAMDTVMDFAVYGGDPEGFFAAATEEIHRLEDLLSRTRDSGDIGRINAGQTVTVQPETAELLRAALHYEELTGGAFDMTIAPLVSAWGIHTEDPHVLTDAEIQELLPLVGREHVHMDGDTVSLDEGCAIDLGGIAKGYASAQLAGLFADFAIEGGWVSLGGNVFTYGTRSDGSPWAVGISDPHDPAATAAALQLSDRFAVTSGGYQRYYTAPDGTVYQHILDPQTGAPARSDLLSVTILSEDGTMADALSTALYVMGEDGAVRFWQAHSEDFELLLITEDDRILYTPGLAGCLTVSEGSGYTARPIE